MDSFEINKIIASILLVALLIIGISKISNIIFKVNKLDSSAYKVELPDNGAKQVSEENTMKSDDKVDISALMALGDICLLYTSPSPRDLAVSRMPSSA